MRTEDRRFARRAGITAAVAFVAVGAAHAPFARPLLMRLGGCPMAGAEMTAAESENARRIAIDTLRGQAPAPARPALGFQLDVTTRADLTAWASRSHVTCDDARPGLVRCQDVPAASLGLPSGAAPVDALSLELDGRGRLVNVTAQRAHLSAAGAAATARTLAATLAAALGSPTAGGGEFDATRLASSGAGSIATVSYRYSDYVADVTAMNAPSGGPSIREHYTSGRFGPRS